jgi:hypothetical protein
LGNKSSFQKVGLCAPETPAHESKTMLVAPNVHVAASSGDAIALFTTTVSGPASTESIVARAAEPGVDFVDGPGDGFWGKSNGNGRFNFGH